MFVPTKMRLLSTLSARADPYKVLGVTSSAPLSEIKLAYFSQAKQFHPDLNKNDAAKQRFLQISEAWEKITAIHEQHEDSDDRMQHLRDLMPTAYKKDALDKFQEPLLHPYLRGYRDIHWAEETVRHAMELDQFIALAKEFPPSMEWKLRFHMRRVNKYLRADPGSKKYSIAWAKKTLEPHLNDLNMKLRALERRVPEPSCHSLVVLHQKQIHRYFSGEWTLEQALEVMDPIFEQHLYNERLKALKQHYPGKQRIVDFNIDLVMRYLTNPEKYPFEWATRKLDKFMEEKK